MSPLTLADQFVAEIHLFPGQQRVPVGPPGRNEYRAILGIEGEQWLARLTYAGAGSPGPGDTVTATVQLQAPGGARLFEMGAQFTVYDAGLKGSGRVVSFAA